jgi:hypothetical protein
MVEGIAVSSLKHLDFSKLVIARDPKADKQMAEMLKTGFVIDKLRGNLGSLMGPPDSLNGVVKQNGKVVAEFYNSGAMTGNMDLSAEPDLKGPALAKWRAQAYVKQWGGTFEASPSALSQAAWAAKDKVAQSFDREAAINKAWLDLMGQYPDDPMVKIIQNLQNGGTDDTRQVYARSAAKAYAETNDQAEALV